MRVNPIEFEVFKNLFLSIAEEMGVTLCRTSFSPNIKERLDYSCAVYDAAGDTIAQGDHMPVHLGAMPLSVRAAIDAIRMEPGDVVMLNDPFRGGTHLPDITLVSPVFIDQLRAGPDIVQSRRGPTPDASRLAHSRSAAAEGSRALPPLGSKTRSVRRPQALSVAGTGHLRVRPDFYVANRAHHSDVGGMSPGSMPVAREIFQEGLIIPPVRLLRRGDIVPDVLALVLSNVRTPAEREGDLTAQIAANRVAERRLIETVARYGRARTLGYAAALQDYTERVIRSAIGEIPDGTYEFEDALDDDGFSDAAIVIRVQIRVKAGRATIDFTGTDRQVTGSVNANYAITLSACLYAFRCLVHDDVLYNAGVSRPLTVIAPEGSIVNARRPAAVAGGNVETSQRITDVVLGALGRALPQQLPAASQGTMNNVTLGGEDPRTGHRFAYYETLGGGMGGRRGLRGLSGVHTHMSNTRNTPIEAIEQYLPIRIRRYGLREGSGGGGDSEGGEGLIREYEMLTGTSVTILSDRRRRSPYGAQGGEPGGPGRNTLIRNGSEMALPGKVQLDLQSGDVLRIETPGGGGYGSQEKVSSLKPQASSLKPQAPMTQ